MHRSTFAVLTLVLGVILSGCSENASSSLLDPNLNNPAALDKLIPSVMTGPPEKMNETMLAAYRLKPDRRVRLAVAYLHHLFTGEDMERTEVTFHKSKWMVHYKGNEVGLLPELADFADLRTFLADWVKWLDKQNPLALTAAESHKYPLLNQALNQYMASEAIHTLHKVDALWQNGVRDAPLLVFAARGLTLMSFQTVDRMQIADPLFAKALAALVLAQTLAPSELKKEECMLAEIMGYSGHAQRVAKTFDNRDPLKLYVERNDPALAQIASQKNASTESRYLWLLRLATKQNVDAMNNWMANAFGDFTIALPILKTGLESSSYFTSRNFTREIQEVVLWRLEQTLEPEGTENQPPPLMRAFLENNAYYQVLDSLLDLNDPTVGVLEDRLEENLEEITTLRSGVFLDGTTYRRYYQSYFYSAMYVEGRYYLYTLSSLESAQEFLAEMKGRVSSAAHKVKAILKIIMRIAGMKPKLVPGHSFLDTWDEWFGSGKEDPPDYETTLANDFERWYEDLVAVEAATGNGETLGEDLVLLQSLGINPLYKTLLVAEKFYNPSAPQRIRNVKRLVYRMDSRNRHKEILGYMAKQRLHDLGLAEKMFSSLSQTGPIHYDDIVVENAYYSGNTKMLKKMLNSSRTGLGAKSDILWYLEKLHGKNLKAVMREYERVIKKYPEHWRFSYNYGRYLRENKKYKKSRNVLVNWLKLDVPTPGLERTRTINKIAQSHYLEGNYKSAWKVISRLSGGQQGGTLDVAGTTLEKLGNLKDAENLIRFRYQRYPNYFPSLLKVVSFLWRHERYEEAAKMIHGHPYKITVNNWYYDFSEEFYEIFKDQPVRKVKAALTPILNGKTTYGNLYNLPQAFWDNKKYKAAHLISESIAKTDWNRLYMTLRYYDEYKQWKGRKAALKWARPNIPPDKIERAGAEMIDEKQYDLLWELIPNPAEYQWVLRAAASIDYKGLSKKRRKELIDYYKSKNGSTDYGIIGRFLLGQISKNDLLKSGDAAFKRPVYAYYVGYKAEIEGRFQEASDWYRVILETGWDRYPEYSWAFGRLVAWQGQKKYLSKLDRKKL